MQDYGIWGLLPAVVSIAIAMVTKRVVIALGIGLLTGTMLISEGNPVDGLLGFFQLGIWDQLNNQANFEIILLTLVIGGFMQLLDAAGSFRAFASRAQSYFKTPQKAQLGAWVGGMLIFFTDTGNSLILGPIFKPIFDRLGVAREKLAYILDCTASPVCVLVPFIAWGAYIMEFIEKAQIAGGVPADGYGVFLEVIPYQFYPILTLIGVPLFVILALDFGPMRRAQKKATASLTTKSGSSGDSRFPIQCFIVPLITLAVLIFGSLLYWALTTGLDGAKIRYGMIAGYILASVAGFMFLTYYRVQKLSTLVGFYSRGLIKMIPLATVLVFAWGLGSVSQELGLGPFLASFGDQQLVPMLLPCVAFLLGGCISFATGTSFGAYGLLFPILVPMAIVVDAPLYATIGAILSGGLFGDHASPLSDTTLLASLGASCPHMNHVQTQLPYALVTGVIAFTGYGICAVYESPYVLSVAIALLLVFAFGLNLVGPRLWRGFGRAPMASKSDSPMDLNVSEAKSHNYGKT